MFLLIVMIFQSCTAAYSTFIVTIEKHKSCYSCKHSYYSLFIPLTCVFACTDPELGKRGMGPRLRHVWAEGANCCWNSFCSPLIWEFNCQTQTYAGLRRISSNLKLPVGTQQICPQTENTPRHLCLSMPLHPCGQTKHILFVLSSSDNCCVCDLL